MNVNIKRIVKNTLWCLTKEKKKIVFEEKLKRLKNQKDDSTIYVISRNERAGLFSYVETTLRQVAYALDNGMIPIVDMRGNENSYVEDCDFDTVNMWDLFFEQPVGIKGDIYGKKIFSEECNMSKIPYRGDSIFLKESSWYWMKMYNEFFKLNNIAREYCDKEFKDLFKGTENRILGVHVRGTDMINAKGHNIQPDIDVVLKQVQKLLKSGKFDKVYLATESYANVVLFREKLGCERVIVNSSEYYDSVNYDNGQAVNEVSFERENDRYLRGLEYLSAVMLLSKCGGIIGGLCGGTVAAYYINGGKYRYTKLYDLGMNK